jgi:hypothetical protein
MDYVVQLLSNKAVTIFIVYIIVITTFALLYRYALPNNSFVVNYDTQRSNITITEAFMTSVSNQTLLGIGNVIPQKAVAQWLIMAQVTLTMISLLFLYGAL